METIMGPAAIYPEILNLKALPSCHNPLPTDRFWFIHRQFCDRAGWDDVREAEQQEPQPPPMEDLHIPDIADMNLYNPDVYVDSDSNCGSDREEEEGVID